MMLAKLSRNERVKMIVVARCTFKLPQILMHHNCNIQQQHRIRSKMNVFFYLLYFHLSTSTVIITWHRSDQQNTSDIIQPGECSDVYFYAIGQTERVNITLMAYNCLEVKEMSYTQ
jgi:hypothetical protein